MVKSAASSKVPPVPKPKLTAMPRRFWTPKEEEVLLGLLDALVAESWKCDGTFQGGYMTRLAREMNDKLPGCGLLVKHIRSKLQVWKRCHAALQGVLGSSRSAGFIMYPSLGMLVEDRADAWADFQKADPSGYKLVKGKLFPCHDRWLFIFGKDQAAGGERYDMEDAQAEVQNLSLNSDSQEDESTKMTNLDGTETACEEDDASSKGPSKNKRNANKATSKKRKSLCDDPAKITAMIGDWMETTKGQINEVSSKMLPAAAPDDGQPGDDSAKRARIYSAITEACDLELEEVITATHHFAHSKPDMDTFWGMPVFARAKFVGMVLHGKLT